jgi:hypothetical protein
MELRCPANVLFGIISDDANGMLEVKCRGKWCGHKSGVVVLHKFDLSNGKIVENQKYRDPSGVLGAQEPKK